MLPLRKQLHPEANHQVVTREVTLPDATAQGSSWTVLQVLEYVMTTTREAPQEDDPFPIPEEWRNLSRVIQWPPTTHQHPRSRLADVCGRLAYAYKPGDQWDLRHVGRLLQTVPLPVFLDRMPAAPATVAPAMTAMHVPVQSQPTALPPAPPLRLSASPTTDPAPPWLQPLLDRRNRTALGGPNGRIPVSMPAPACPWPRPGRSRWTDSCSS